MLSQTKLRTSVYQIGNFITLTLEDTNLFNDGISGVKVQGSEEIWLVAGIDLAFALGVENGEGKLYP